MTQHTDHIQPVQRRDRELRRSLDAQRDQLLSATRSRLRELQQEGGAEADDVLDEGDASEADVQTELELALLEMQREALVKIDMALVELAEGTYGYCISCNGQIATRRLAVLPFAIRCTSCEERHEADVRRRPDASAWRPADGPIGTAM